MAGDCRCTCHPEGHEPTAKHKPEARGPLRRNSHSDEGRLREAPYYRREAPAAGGRRTLPRKGGCPVRLEAGKGHSVLCARAIARVDSHHMQTTFRLSWRTAPLSSCTW